MIAARLQLPLPKKCIAHIKLRILQREITEKDYRAFTAWIIKQPIVDSGDWYKRFNNFFLVGTGPTATSVLDKNMVPYGKEIF